MIKVIIADDHAVIRKGIAMFIDQTPDIEVIGEASDGDELIAMLKFEKPDVILLDIDMPSTNGISALRHIDLKHPRIKIIMLSMHPEEIYGKTSRKLGASGYVSKNSEPKEIIEAVRTVNNGKAYFNNEVHDRLSNGLEPLRKLSKRESEVLKLLSSGKANKDVAEELNISDKTVSTYKLRLMTKLGAKSMVDLIHFAQKYPFAR